MMLELGGNAPLVVLEDADLELAVHAAVVSKFLHQGQICVIANRILVHEKIYEALVDRYVARVRNLKTGNPNDPDTVIGPLISQKQLLNVQRSIAAAPGSRALERVSTGGFPCVIAQHQARVCDGATADCRSLHASTRKRWASGTTRRRSPRASRRTP
jgi:acyl-CoA reductase-like NAD-dependent aldehyde dehydrogenase